MKTLIISDNVKFAAFVAGLIEIIWKYQQSGMIGSAQLSNGGLGEPLQVVHVL